MIHILRWLGSDWRLPLTAAALIGLAAWLGLSLRPVFEAAADQARLRPDGVTVVISAGE